MIEMLSDTIGTRAVDALGFLLAFALTALMDSMFRERLPHDHGRAFAVNGELSKGKARGSGLIFVLCIALVTLAVIPFRVEYLIYTVLLIASMLSGYFDDAADTAWNEYKKGLIDFVIAVVAGVTYLNFNGTGVQLLNWAFSIPVYLLLIVVLIWASRNVPTVWTASRPAWQWCPSARSCWPIGRSWASMPRQASSSSVPCWPTCGPMPNPPPC